VLLLFSNFSCKRKLLGILLPRPVLFLTSRDLFNETILESRALSVDLLRPFSIERMLKADVPGGRGILLLLALHSKVGSSLI